MIAIITHTVEGVRALYFIWIQARSLNGLAVGGARNQTMGTRIAAIIGCNSRVDPHVLAYRHIDPQRARIVACCDIVAERTEQAASRHGLEAFTDAGAMLEQIRPDLVHVATGPTGRHELLRQVAEAGVPACTVEKPVATGVGDWRALNRLQAETATRFAVCHQFRWHEDVVRCRKALGDQELGKVLLLDVSAGFNISGQGTHILNYARSFHREQRIASVFATASGAEHLTGLHPAPGTTLGLIVFEDGVRCLMQNGYTAPRCGSPAVPWQHVRLAAYTERGRVLYEEFGRWQIVRAGLTEEGHFGDNDQWMAANLRAQAAFHEAMLDWMDGGPPPGTELAESLHEWHVVLAFYASALWRRPVAIDAFDPPDDLIEQLRQALPSRNDSQMEHAG